MNKSNLLIIGCLLLMVILMPACDKTESVLQTTEGALPVISDVTSGFFDISDIANASAGFTLDVSGVPVNSVEIRKRFNDQVDGTVSHANVSSFPSVINIPIADALTGLGIEANDLTAGDAINLTFVMSTADGRTLNANVTFPVLISCSSDLGGTYIVSSNVLFADNGPQTYEYETELVDLGDGMYTIDDVTGGAWGINYADLYGTSARAGTLIHVCSDILIPAVDDQFGFQIMVSDGKIDENGVITYKWQDTGYDDNGEVTLTPK